MIRVPGILAGLKERSQSAYAMPAPKPVPSATGHARPARDVFEFEQECCGKEGRWIRTTEEDDGRDDTRAEADTAGENSQLATHSRCAFTSVATSPKQPVLTTSQ